MPRQFKELVSLAKQVKSLYIVYAPSIDCALSAAILLRFFRTQDVDVFLAPFFSASKPIGNAVVISIGILQRPSAGEIGRASCRERV